MNVVEELNRLIGSCELNLQRTAPGDLYERRERRKRRLERALKYAKLHPGEHSLLTTGYIVTIKNSVAAGSWWVNGGGDLWIDMCAAIRPLIPFAPGRTTLKMRKWLADQFFEEAKQIQGWGEEIFEIEKENLSDIV